MRRKLMSSKDLVGRSRLLLAQTCTVAANPQSGFRYWRCSSQKEPKRPVKADRITPADPSGNSRLGKIGILSLSIRMED